MNKIIIQIIISLVSVHGEKRLCFDFGEIYKFLRFGDVIIFKVRRKRSAFSAWRTLESFQFDSCIQGWYQVFEESNHR